jgi:hypothetical protein
MKDYTIISAYYVNAERTAAIIMTEESGAVAISKQDRPELWKHLLKSKVKIAEMPDQPKIIDPAEPTVITDGSNN